jgi:hypothetical protein
LVRWWGNIGVGASLGWWRLRDSGAFARRCCRVFGIGALVGQWRCHGVGAGALVSEVLNLGLVNGNFW